MRLARPTATGTLRLWTVDASAPRTKRSVTEKTPEDTVGFYVPPGSYSGQNLQKLGFGGGTRSVTLYAEGVAPGGGGITGTLVVLIPQYGGQCTSTDVVGLTVAKVDLDVDSDNTNALNSPDRSAVEDQYEDRENDPDHPGKFVMVNDDDTDNDGIVDFADGFRAFGDNPDYEQTAGEAFTPLVLEIPAGVDPTKARIRITYDDCRPYDGCYGMGVTRSGEPPNYTYALSCWVSPGKLRIWSTDGSTARYPQGIDYYMGGNYVESGTDYAASAFGFSESTRVVTLYMEGVNPSAALGDARIVVEVDPGGSGNYMLMDAVRVTVMRVDLDVDSDNNNGFGAPDRSDLEDQYEDKADDPDHPGKLVLVNDDDTDNDGIPDFADGFNAFGFASFETAGDALASLS